MHLLFKTESRIQIRFERRKNQTQPMACSRIKMRKEDDSLDDSGFNGQVKICHTKI